jgi:hypothetical protein
MDHLLEGGFAHRMRYLSPRLLRLMLFPHRHKVCRFCIWTDSCGFGFTLAPRPEYTSGVCNRPIAMPCRSQKSLTSAWINHQCFCKATHVTATTVSHLARVRQHQPQPFWRPRTMCSASLPRHCGKAAFSLDASSFVRSPRPRWPRRWEVHEGEGVGL